MSEDATQITIFFLSMKCIAEHVVNEGLTNISRSTQEEALAIATKAVQVGFTLNRLVLFRTLH